MTAGVTEADVIRYIGVTVSVLGTLVAASGGVRHIGGSLSSGAISVVSGS